jgi:thiamine pyrophosphate-dependent acetolactate synthase large subunit-like protein
MGHAIPAAIGAALAGAQSCAVLGDAEFLMTGYELHTAVENQLPLTVIVLNDAGHGMVRVGSRVHCQGQTPNFDFTTPVDIVAACRAQSAYAARPATVAELERELENGATRSTPTVLDVTISRDLMPPLGARLSSLSQAFGSHTSGAHAIARHDEVGHA